MNFYHFRCCSVMRFARFLIIFLFLWQASDEVCGQTALENKVIASLLNDGNKLIPKYKTSKRKGLVKKFNGHKVPELVLLNVTKSPLRDAEFDTLNLFQRKVLIEKDKGMLHDFCSKNHSSLKIDSVAGLKDRITYIRKSELGKVFPKNGEWHTYYYHFGLKPYVNVSRPGFNEKKNRAFIYLTYKLGKNDGAGYYLVMKKSWGKWRIKGNMLIWVK